MVVVVMDNEANNVSLLIAELTQPLARHLLDPRCSSLGACLLREREWFDPTPPCSVPDL